MEALKNEQLVEVKKCKGKRGNDSNGQAKTKGLLKSDSEAATMENTAIVSTIARHLAPTSVVLDSKIAVEQYDIATGIKSNDRKSESDSPLVTTKEARVEETSERVGTRAKGRTSLYHPIHFGHGTSIPATLNSTKDRNRTIFISEMPEAPVTDPVAADARNRHQTLQIGQRLFPDIHSTTPPH
ncbi:hypothetical protein ACOME3_008969 [Neoechinorhynchus agilis]